MTIDMYNEFAAGGCLLIPHILVKVLSANTCVLLSRLISEYNYANNHKLNRDNDFLSSFSHLKNILGFNDEELNIALNDLIKIGFISIFPSGIEDTLYIRIFEYKILEFKREQIANNYYTKWDSGLNSIVNPQNKKTSFLDTTNEIKSFFDERLKNLSVIPMILYSYLDDIIGEFDTAQIDLIEELDMYSYMYSLVQNKKFNAYDFEKLIDFIETNGAKLLDEEG